MKRNFLLTVLLGGLSLIIGCSKAHDFDNDKILAMELKESPTAKPGSRTLVKMEGNARTYNGFVDLITMPNGHFTDGHIRFSDIIYQTGDFLDGEPVSDIYPYFDPVLVPNLLWSATTGPFFIYVQGTIMGGYTPYFLDDLNAFNNAYSMFKDSGFYRQNGIAKYSMPNLEDFLGEISTGTNGELISSGVVVRRHNSGSTFAIAPPSFTPVNRQAGTDFYLGHVTEGNYEINIYAVIGYGGLSEIGPINAIEIFDVSNGYQEVNFKGFVGSYEERQTNPQSGYDVVGEVTLLDNSILSFTGIANGL